LSGRYARAHGDAALRDELRGIIDRAHRHGLQVIGPQVEDPQGAATLWMSGIDFIQGNLVQQAAGELDFDFQHSVL
jgi:EAL domain-containing protein (putative c-di-GMP-specific phosphodiesterase class I)